MIGEVLPDRSLYATDAASFARAAGRHGRDWLFHARVERLRSGRQGSWSIGQPGTLARIARALNLEGDYHLEPLEFLPGREPGAPAPLPWVFCQQADVSGPSLELALALGLLSADTEVPLPPWALFSGRIRTRPRGRPLAIGKVGQLRRKIKAALGLGEGNQQVAGLLDEWSQVGDISRYLGEPATRTLPGRVRLFLGQPRGHSAIEEMRDCCSLLRLGLSPQTLREAFRGGPPGTVGEFAQRTGVKLPDGWSANDPQWLLFAGPPTLAEALVILDLPGRWEAAREDMACYLLQPRRLPDGRPRRDAEDWRLRERVLREYLDRRVQGSVGYLEQLRALLETCIRELNGQPGLEGVCFGGSVGSVSFDRKLIHCLERTPAPGVEPALYVPQKLFPIYPADQEPTATALEQKRPILTLDLANNPSIQEGFRYELAQFVGQHHLPRELLSGQEQFLRNLHASLALPVISRTRSEAIGVVSLLMNRPLGRDQFPTELIELFRGLVEVAVEPVQAYLGTQRAVPENLGDSESDDDYLGAIYACPEFLPNQREGTEHKLRKANARTLARKACRLPNVSRAVVRLLDPEVRFLSPEAEAPEGAFDADWLKRPIAVELRDSTASHAIKSGRDVFLDDTDYLFDFEGHAVPHKPVGPKPAVACASVLLRFAGQTMGVLSVDFDSKLIPPAVRTALRKLAADYALLFKACAIDRTFAQLDVGLLTPFSCLRHVAGMLSADHAALFLRDPDSGLYVLKDALGHSDHWRGEWHNHYGKGVQPGHGLVGWIARHNRPLRLANARSGDELQSASVDGDAPRWFDRGFLDRECPAGPVAYLGVPLAVDKAEVHGVMRFMRFAPQGDRVPAWEGRAGFTTYDEQAAVAATARLAPRLQRECDLKRTQALEQLLQALGRSLAKTQRVRDRQRDFARLAFSALGQGLGRCSSGIRLCDEVVFPDGSEHFALRLLAWEDPDWESVAPLYRSDEGSPAVRAFRSGQLLENEDLEEGVSEPEREAQLNQKYRNPLVKRLGGEAGTVYVARYATAPNSQDQFSAAERAFFERVAEIIGHGMLKIAEDEQMTLENTILRRLVEDFGGSSLAESLGEVLRRLHDLFNLAWACVWVAGEGVFAAHDLEARPLPAAPVSADVIAQELGRRGPRVVTLPKRVPAQILAPLFRGLAPEAWDQCERAALPIRELDGTVLGVFALTARRNETLSVRRLKRVAEFLTCLTPFVRQRLGFRRGTLC